jgi:hypothetical protein
MQLRRRTTGDKSLYECKNIDGVDAITFEPIISLPSNRLIRLDSGWCTDIMNFLRLYPNNGEYKDPTTRQVFTNELINEVKRRLISLNQVVPAWMNDYDANQEEEEEEEEGEYVYETDDDDSPDDEDDSPQDEPRILSHLITKAKYEISTSQYDVDNDMIKQALEQSSGDNTF